MNYSWRGVAWRGIVGCVQVRMENGKIVRAKATTEALREREEKRLKKELEKRAADAAAKQVWLAAALTASSTQPKTRHDRRRRAEIYVWSAPPRNRRASPHGRTALSHSADPRRA